LSGYSAYSGYSGGNYIAQYFTGVSSVVVGHNFGVRPVVNVLTGDGSGGYDSIVPLNIKHNSTNQTTVSLSSSTSGYVICKA